MTDRWIIVATEPRKEIIVEASLKRLGYDAWCPIEVRMARPGISRRSAALSNLRKTVQLPVLPGCLFAAISVTTEADCASVRYVTAIKRNSASTVLQIPGKQLSVFRAQIDRLNAETNALAKIVQTGKKKKVWKDMREALEELVAGSKVVLEDAA